MAKKAFQIFSLIFSVIALAFMILSYIQITRYFQLHIKSTESYIKKYPTLPKANKERTVIAFTTTPDKLNNMKPFINSILDQTVRVDDIALNIPYKYFGQVPDDLKKIVSVYGYNIDYENVGDMICSILREPEGNTRIILVDPETIYGNDFVETIVDESENHPDEIIYGGKDKTKRSGILIRPSFFDDKICHYEKGTNIGWLNKCCNAKEKIIQYSPLYKIM
jgi:hypothetical protein